MRNLIDSRKAKTFIMLILLAIITIVVALLYFGSDKIMQVLLVVGIIFAWLVYVILIPKPPAPAPKVQPIPPIEYEAYSKEVFSVVAEIAELVHLQTPLSNWNLYPLHGEKEDKAGNNTILRFHALCKPQKEIDIRKIHKLLQLTLNRRFAAGQSLIKTKKNQCICVARVFTDEDVLEIQVYYG